LNKLYQYHFVDRVIRGALYFVVETKGSTLSENIRPKEHGKIDCSEHHFNEVGESDNPVKYILATNVKDLAKHIA
jgi:restriction endonuclease